MTEVVVATLNVNFSAESEGTGGAIKLEIDDREDGLNGGNTSFAPGDVAYFFLFKDDDVTLITDTPERTAGGVTSSGSATKVVDEYLTFSNSDTSSLGYPPDGAVTCTWIGRCLQLSGTTLTVNSNLPEVNGSELKMADGEKVIGILRCQYNSTGSLWKLSNVPKDIADVLVFAIGTVG